MTLFKVLTTEILLCIQTLTLDVCHAANQSINSLLHLISEALVRGGVYTVFIRAGGVL